MAKKLIDYSDNEIYGMMIGLFLALGITVGALLDNVGAGIAIGVGLAIAAAEGVKAQKRKRQDADRDSGPEQQ